MLTVWGRKTSSNVQAVMWCIAELGLDYQRHDVGHRYGGNDTPEFLAMNPNGLVPVLKDGDDEPLWESAAIVRYLASRYGKSPFWPENLSARAQVDKWAEWSKLNVALGFTTPIFWRVWRTAPANRDGAAIAAALAALAKTLNIADQQLTRHEFLAGNDLTVADIMFSHVLYRYYTIDIERPSHPALERYYAMLTNRPAYSEHVMVSYEELRAT